MAIHIFFLNFERPFVSSGSLRVIIIYLFIMTSAQRFQRRSTLTNFCCRLLPNGEEQSWWWSWPLVNHLWCIRPLATQKSRNCKQGGRNKSVDSFLSSFAGLGGHLEYILSLLDPLGGWCQATVVSSLAPFFGLPGRPNSISSSSPFIYY